MIDDIDELIDEPFFQAYNEVDGVLEDLKRIVLDDYKVENTLGITEEVIDYANSSSMADLATKEIVKETIGLKDLLHNEDISGVGELQSFNELFKEQYETLSEANEDLANMSYGEYVESLIGRSNIQHTVDKGWLNVLGEALDIIGITSLIGSFTGTNVFTGQILTPGERKSAAFTAIINIGSLALAISTAGAGGLLALGFKGATKVAATATFKWCMVNMISGMSGLLVGGVLDMLGAPTWLKIAGTLGGAALGRSIANKKLFTTVVKGSIDDIANKTGLPENQIQDIMNYKKMTAEELALALNGGASIESLLGLPDMNMKYLMEQTGMSAEDIRKLLDAKGQNINSINGSNIDSTIQMLKEADINPNQNVLDVMSNNKQFYKDSTDWLDCSEIADDLLEASGGKGTIYEIKSNQGTLNVQEYGTTQSFDYHTVYSDGTYIYDPRFSYVPILKDEYFSLLEKLNPQGITIN